MVFPLYFAMTGAEFRLCNAVPKQCGWLSCHFSSYSQGITNTPQHLPKSSMLILDDSTPVSGHSPEQVTKQITDLLASSVADSVLLDFQRPPTEESLIMTKALIALPCPVGVSESHAKDLTCPVFLSPPPLHVPLQKHITPWQGREIWLEAALGQESVAVTREGLRSQPWIATNNPTHFSQELACHYQIVPGENEVRFLFHRTREDLDELLIMAESLGIQRAIGLYQELA